MRGWCQQPMSTRASALLQAALRRPLEDVLSRCKLSSKSPAVTTLTRTMSEAAPLILAKWPACRHQHVDEACPSDTQSFDLLLTGSCSPAHLAANLERVSPGGALAMAVRDPPPQQFISGLAPFLLVEGRTLFRTDIRTHTFSYEKHQRYFSI